MQAAAAEKEMAGEGRQVEHVALQNDVTLAKPSKKPAGRKRAAATEGVPDQHEGEGGVAQTRSKRAAR